MRRIFASIFLVISIVSLLVIAFTTVEVFKEEASLTSDLQYRSALLANSLKETVEPYIASKSQLVYLQKLVDKFADKERSMGVSVYDNKENVLASSSILPKDISESGTLVGQVMDEDKAGGTFTKIGGEKVYLFALPLHNNGSVTGALMVVQNAQYINQRIEDIWKSNLIRLIIQSSLLALAVVWIIRFLVYEPIKRLVSSIKMVQSGRFDERLLEMRGFSFFQPLIKEVLKLGRSLTEARMIASEEARLRLEKVESPWTAQRLQEFVKAILKGRSILLVSNREPYIHVKAGNEIRYFEPASGMVTAIEPMMQACGGIWIAYGSGDADKLVVDGQDRVRVPPEDPKYTLKRVWLTEEEEQGYYYGFSNEGLWPLCHNVHIRPVFRKEDWYQYAKVNGKFTHTILKEVKDIHKPLILIQDYHFALLPRMIKKSRTDATIGIFWHIPWPNAESFSICPWRKELLDGMLGADLIGFHTQYHCNNFIETVGRELESLIDWERFIVTRDDHQSYIKSFPISIPFVNGNTSLANTNDPLKFREELTNSLNVRAKYIGLGVDRLDYTKGLVERMKAVESFLDSYPSYREEFTFIQIAAPSRSVIERYRQFAAEVRSEVNRINDKFQTREWKPIILLERHHTHPEIKRYYQAADVCLVTSLHDGMNLVAKEFVASRDDEQAVLILSQFAGASRELKDSIIVNPYNIEQIGEAIRSALVMLPTERKKRMTKMREKLRNYNVYRWFADLLKDLVNIEQ